LKGLKISLPSISEQKEIAIVLSTIDDKLDVLLEKKTHYQELKQGLMQQLLTGKIRVNNLIAQI
jgi:type I restriction enzyme S subunit